ncbi:putative sarcoplasmic reticulum glycoprotein [Leishmania major strain Friedlin]|uniref:Sarcalumenin n=1 Tax=Leishmania major TaxID=5664 RepID=Q4QDJ3_LEIMA|nr:putative sarcoplasmic reticulum glycoprotein [Leishmania major strain Friedlin]CAG9572714.1 Sarcalumenin_-_putative [Leishmania major strain Friedlin]CAJ07113.1 putative sarcoplasmic reticulum glycoprotein [Leishmania major strain Friedlin]|eukprot:XP_001682605.1 putative sarcoplasmic reticulum glycoprotein [Leishmania major strain Friedlin]
MSISGAAAPAPLRGRESGGNVPGSMGALIKKLHPLYTQRVRPLEEMYSFDVFRPSWYEETILNERPFITLFGPWSAGKTTFINYLLQSNDLWTGPQPTTAEFTVVMYGKEPGPVAGQALANSKHLPFKGLLDFGESFIRNLKGFQAPHALLERVTLIDTPGVLESAKDIHQRKYDYVNVCRWFAERSDLIFVFFDPSKLDAGGELRQLFQTSFKGFENRLRLVLNKADTISTQELMRVYGSLFWNLSNFINTTEPPRVYVGSFWDKPYSPNSFSRLFAEEKLDLLHELLEVIPQQARDKKVASLIRRAKEVLVHAVILGGIRADLPLLFGKSKAKKKAAEQLPRRYELIGARYKMNHRDFPPVQAYRSFLERFDVAKFPPLQKAEKAGLIRGIQELIDTILPSMLRPVCNTRAANPFEEDKQTGLLSMYRDHVLLQRDGRPGMQGGTDKVASTMGQGVPDSATTGPSSSVAAAPASGPSSLLGPGPAVTALSASPPFIELPSRAMAASSTAVAASSPPPPPPSSAAATSSPADMQAMMAIMQQMVAYQQQQQQQQDRQSSSAPATVNSHGTLSSSSSETSGCLAESSVPVTPQESNLNSEPQPPTVVPQLGLPNSCATQISAWAGGDESKSQH